VFIFDDRIEMWNSGEMPKGLSLDKLQSGDYEPSARNPLLTRVFKEIGLIENLGSGLHKVCRLLKDAGLALPSIESLASGTRIVIRSTVEYPEKYPVNISKSEAAVLKVIVGRPRITREQIAQKTGLSLPAIKKIVFRLKKKELLRRIGPDKGGHWKVV